MLRSVLLSLAALVALAVVWFLFSLVILDFVGP